MIESEAWKCSIGTWPCCHWSQTLVVRFVSSQLARFDLGDTSISMNLRHRYYRPIHRTAGRPADLAGGFPELRRCTVWVRRWSYMSSIVGRMGITCGVASSLSIQLCLSVVPTLRSPPIRLRSSAHVHGDDRYSASRGHVDANDAPTLDAAIPATAGIQYWTTAVRPRCVFLDESQVSRRSHSIDTCFVRSLWPGKIRH